MKAQIVFVIVCLLVQNLLGRQADQKPTIADTSFNDLRQSSSVASHNMDKNLSNNPTSQELATILESCGDNASEATSAIARKGDKSLPGLVLLLYASPIRGQDVSGTVPVDIEPNKAKVVAALEALQTQSGDSVLVKAAVDHPSREVRGPVLHWISKDYYERIRAGGLMPNKSIIAALVSNLDDETLVPVLNTSVGQTAQRGLMIWLGKDFGDPEFKSARTLAGRNNQESTPGAYAKHWLKQNGDRLAWNSETSHFEIR